MVPGRLVQLGLQALFKKEESVSFVLVQENSCKPQSLLRAKIQDHTLDFHSFSASGHFLIIDLLGTLPEDLVIIVRHKSRTNHFNKSQIIFVAMR
jgi:hypothetical protein